MEKKTGEFDVAVIGGGPAGLMAAGRAGELGKEVILIERNENLGRKLLLTGNGRCNLTNVREKNLKEFAFNFGKEGDFLLSALAKFGPEETLEFFRKRGLKTKIEDNGRVFPESDNAEDVLSVFKDYLNESRVVIKTGSRVKKIVKKENLITKIITEGGEEISAKNYLLCTGGRSYSETGSTGDGFDFAKEFGHKIAKLRPALVPIKTKEDWVKNLQGVSLKNVKLKVFSAGKKKIAKTGEIIFTHFGISGPLVLDLSLEIGEVLAGGIAKIFLDLYPEKNLEELDECLQIAFSKSSNKLLKNALPQNIPQSFSDVISEISEISQTKKVNLITRFERRNLGVLLKNIELTPLSLLDFDDAMITAGGVSLKEIDSRTMKSRLVDNLFFAGEIIDLKGLSGGFNLQACWTTGYVAGSNI